MSGCAGEDIRMERVIRNIFALAVVVLFALPFAAACSDDDLDAEKTKIENEVIGKFPEDYERFGDIWRVKLNADRNGYAQDITADTGDSIHFRFYLYPFSSGSYGNYRNALWSNDTVVRNYMARKGLDITHWPEAPERVKLGTTSLGPGIGVGLGGPPGVRERDSIFVFVPYDKVGDSHSYGILPKESSIVWCLKIDKVIKQS